MADPEERPATGTKVSKRKAMWQMDWACKFCDNNPKMKNSQAFGRFAAYKAATTIREAINLGACMRDLDADFKAGHLTCQEASADLAEGQAATCEVEGSNPSSKKTRRRSWTQVAASPDVPAEPNILPLPVLSSEAEMPDAKCPDVAAEQHVLPLPLPSHAGVRDETHLMDMQPEKDSCLLSPRRCAPFEVRAVATMTDIQNMDDFWQVDAGIQTDDVQTKEQTREQVDAGLQTDDELAVQTAGQTMTVAVQTDDAVLHAELGDLTMETYRLREQLFQLGIRPWEPKTRRPVTLGVRGST